jgi:hypothetical protein
MVKLKRIVVIMDQTMVLALACLINKIDSYGIMHDEIEMYRQYNEYV